VLLQLNVAIVVGFASGCNDEFIIGKISRRSCDGPVLRINSEHLGHPDCDILSVMEDLPEREGDAGRLYLRGGNLVEKRLKLVVV
jgi:hypothetical protein